MKISEIQIVPDREEYPESYKYHFYKTNNQKKLSTGLDFKINKDNYNLHLGVFDKDKIVAYVSLHKENQYWQVDMQSTDIEYRNQGYVRYCIEYAIHNYYPVISDVNQTNLSKKVWTALIEFPHGITYSYLNLENGKNIAIQKDKQTNDYIPNPWDDTDHTVILATPKPVDKKILEMREKREQWNRKNNRRDPWLGQGFIDYNP